MFLLASNCRMFWEFWVRCTDEVMQRQLGLPKLSSLLRHWTKEYAAGSSCRFAHLSSDPMAKNRCKHSYLYWRTCSTWIKILVLALFYLGDTRCFYWLLWSFFSSSRTKELIYHNQQWFFEENLVQFEDTWWYPNISASSLRSLFSHFAQTFWIPKSSVVIFQILSVLSRSWFVSIQIIHRRLPHTICHTHTTLIPVHLIKNPLLLETTFNSLFRTCCYARTLVKIVTKFSTTRPIISALFV